LQNYFFFFFQPKVNNHERQNLSFLGQKKNNGMDEMPIFSRCLLFFTVEKEPSATSLIHEK